MVNLYLLLERKTPSWIKAVIPASWRVWLGYQIKVGRWRLPGNSRGRSTVDPLHCAMALPAGETEASLFDYLADYHVEGEGVTEERNMYLHVAYRRFLQTLALVPDRKGRLLEIGAGPYFLSLLLLRFRKQYELFFTNFYGAHHPREAQQTMCDQAGRRVPIPYHNVNLEEEALPFESAHFDVVLLCEVLEHFTQDPLCALLEIRRVLKPGGLLLLTTPNVVRLENVARVIAGENVYDPYSGYGPHGRHNREYTQVELRKLLEHAGFEVEQMFTCDVHHNVADSYLPLSRLEPFLQNRAGDLGQYIFSCSRHNGTAESRKPQWLYRSYPPATMV
jgi:SAM-dependent methyltransferase